MTLGSVQIREATSDPDEMRLLREILLECSDVMASLGESRWEADEFETSFLNVLVSAHQLFVVLLDRRIVGTFKIQRGDPLFWPEMGPDDAVYLHKIAISKDGRGKDLTAEIIRWAKAYTASIGRKFLRLDTDWKRPGLCRLYERLGFTPHSRKKLDFIEVVRFEMRVS